MASLSICVLVVFVGLGFACVQAAETGLSNSLLPDKEDSLVADPSLPYQHQKLPPDLGIRSSTPCPKGCTCSKQSCGAEVDCSGLMLTEVPAGISPLTECLDLSMNNITNINVESFRELKHLKKLCLSGNVITDLPSDFFTMFREMHTLFLQDNLIKTVPANTVSKMPNLKNLNLGANYISEISPNAFVRLESLAHIWLDDNFLEEIPARALSKATSIKALSLDMNRISRIRSDDFKQLKELNVLLLKHNRIYEIEAGVFEGTINLQILELSYNNLTSFPVPVKNIFKLKRLMLNENKIETLPGMAFAGNPDIEILSVTGNPLRSVDRTSFTGLNHLQSLSLENINDQEVFPDFSDCSSLQKLTITGGKIYSLPSNLCNTLPSLEHLSVDGNRLRNLSGLQSCHLLTVLRASRNEVAKLRSSEISNLNNLQELDLSGNEIDEIDQDAFSTMSLQRLNLGNNFFTYLPVRGIGSLRELNVTGVRTLLYLPPIELFHSLSSLVAFYPYHCCQLAKASRLSGKQWITRVNQFESYGQHRTQVSPIMAPRFPASSTPAVQCTPDPGPLTPCDDLLPSTALRIFSWLFMVVTLILNGLILFSCGLRYSVQRRQRRRRGRLETGDIGEMLDREGDMIDSTYLSNPDAHIVESDGSDLSKSHYFLNISRAGTMSNDNDTFDVILCHLAFADVIVTIYTAVILSYDNSTLGEFAEHGAWWQQSALCHSTGFLLTFGIQLSFCTIVIMAVERYLVAMHPLQPEKHLKTGLVLTLTLISAWILSLVSATVTLFGGGGLESGETIRDLLPAQNGAACLPWTTDFTYVAVLVGVHVLFCVFATLLCLLILCGSPKQTWLIPKKNTRRQVALTITFNLAFIVPLAIIALYVSGVMNFSKLEPGENGEYYSVGSMVTTVQSDDSNVAVLDMGRVLAFVMFVIPFRPFLNPILYIIFNKPLRRDLVYLGRKIFVGDTRERSIPFPQDQTNVLETMYDGSVMASHQANNSFPLFPQAVFDSRLLQRTAYDNGGIATPSVVTPSIRSLHTVVTHSADRSSSNHVSTLQGSERGRRRRRRSRSRRAERRPLPDSDLTTESEMITFHRANSAAYYNPEPRERRRKKLSVRNGGVNAKDEFQRLVFPRHPLASSSSHGSDSTVYPILPSNRPPADLPPVPTMNASESVTKENIDSKAQSKLVTSNQKIHYDLSALQTLHTPNKDALLSREINNNSSKSSSASLITGDVTATLSNAVDLEVASITSSMVKPACGGKDGACFEEKDLTKRSSLDSVRRKGHQRAMSREEDYLLLAVRNASRNEALKELDPNTRLPLSRKNSTASHSSASRVCDLTERGEKVISGCDYCDSSTSKDSGIHSEIDSTSGASYSDTSIGRRLRFSTSGVLTNLINSDSNVFSLSPIQNTYRVNENDIARFELSAPLKTQDFQILPATTTSSHVKNFSEILNTETAI